MWRCKRICRLSLVLLKRYWIVVVWSAACSLVFYLDYMKYKMEPQYFYVRRMLGLGMCISRGTAAVLNLSCCALVLPMCRALITTLASAYKRCRSHSHTHKHARNPGAIPATLTAPATHFAKTTHVMVAVTVLVTSVTHTGAHLANAINFSRHYSSLYPELNVATFRGETPLMMFVATVPGVTGVVMVVVLAALWLTSTRWVRKRGYDVFYYTHRLGLAFLLLLVVHPLSGVLKEQKNLKGHIPGCKMYKPHEGEYTAIEANHTHPERSQLDPEVGYPEPDVGYPDSEVGYPEPDVGYPDSEVGFPEPSVGYPTQGSNNQHSGAVAKESSQFETFPRAQWRPRKCHNPPVFGSIHSKTWMWVGCALAIWAVDMGIRLWRRRIAVEIVSVVHHPCDLVQLTLRQTGFTCKPGQYVLLQCPKLSSFEWHPFTVMLAPSTSSPGMFTVMMKARGDWTKHLACLLQPYSSHLHNSSQEPLIGQHASASLHSSAERLTTHGSNSQLSLPYHQPRLNNPSVDETKAYSFSPGNMDNNLKNILTSKSLGDVDGSKYLEISCSSNVSIVNSVQTKYHVDTPCSYQSYSHTNNFINTPVHPSCKLCNHVKANEKHFNALSLNIHTDKKCSTYKNAQERDHTHHNGESKPIRLYVDGPFSSPSEDMTHYPVIISAAGGVGITPLAATLSHILHYPNSWPIRVHMIWVMRDVHLLSTLAPLLSSLLQQCWENHTEDRLEFCMHVTVPAEEEIQMLSSRYPSLLPRIKYGRPNWKATFQQYRQFYERTKVGVFACGPKKLCRQVRRTCLQEVTKGALFDYHQESFS